LICLLSESKDDMMLVLSEASICCHGEVNIREQ
jgi:hypothetical protein